MITLRAAFVFAGLVVAQNVAVVPPVAPSIAQPAAAVVAPAVKVAPNPPAPKPAPPPAPKAAPPPPKPKAAPPAPPPPPPPPPAKKVLEYFPRELTEKSFDHDTQLGTHDTTGSWFIKFYAPWCGHCQRMESVWNELANDVHGQLNVGSVDATANKKLAERFKITGYPTLILFHKQKMYRFAGARSLEAFKAFALEQGFEKVAAEPIPKPITTFDMIKITLVNFAYDFEAVISEKPAAAGALAFSGVCAGMALGSLVTGVLFTKRFKTKSKKID